MNGTSLHTSSPAIPASTSNRMVYRLTTRDGTAVFVEEADIALITEFLASKGYPPVSVDLADESSRELLAMIRSPAPAPFNP